MFENTVLDCKKVLGSEKEGPVLFEFCVVGMLRKDVLLSVHFLKKRLCWAPRVAIIVPYYSEFSVFIVGNVIS